LYSGQLVAQSENSVVMTLACVVYTTFHHPTTQANVITTEFSDWATNCPEYKVTAVQISPSNGPSEWQKEYDEQARQSRRIAMPVVEAAE